MIPFDRIYSWLFKSFNISGETELIDRLIADGHTEVMIIKRSWIFALLMLWIPIVILGLSGLSIWIAYDSIDIDVIKYTLIVGNILMSLILVISSLSYISHFRAIHGEARIETDTKRLSQSLSQGDDYFRSFFNWSITNQFILVAIIIAELILLSLYGKRVGEHFWILAADTLVIILEITFLRYFRKRMMDLEMDYNVIVAGKIFFVNQSGILSTIQTIEGDKIKTVQSSFPSKVASFFNYGTVNVLTEGDTQAMMGTMSMYYVTNPDGVVAQIQSLIEEPYHKTETPPAIANVVPIVTPSAPIAQAIPQAPDRPIGKKESQRHSLDTREKIRDVLR